MRKISGPQEKTIGSKAHIPALAPGGSWVQTERAAHEAWARLAHKNSLAGAILHVLVARMGNKNAVVVSQKTLAKIMGVTDRSIRTAVAILESENWIQIVQINGPGTVAAYVVNSAVAWSQKRENLHLSTFSAIVIADADDQKNGISHRTLRKIPMIYADEKLLPTGPGEDPPAQPLLDGFEQDMPVLKIDPDNLEEDFG